jgi:RND family efflux transporter MFP subunit
MGALVFVSASVRDIPPRHRAVWALGLFLAAAACDRAPEAEVADVRPVRTVTITEAASSTDVSLTGRVQARAEINQSFRLPGQLIERNVDVGDNVRVGQQLARLDSQNEQSALQAAQAQLVAAQVQLADARNNYTRMKNLIVDNAVSRASYDHSEALLRGAEAQVQAVRSQVQLAQNRVDFTRLKAEVSGVVTSRGPEVGEVVAAGQPIVQIAQAGAVDAIFDVPAAAKDTLTRQSTIWVSLLSDPGVRARGTVREVSPRADPVTGTFRIRIGIANAPPAMRLGSTVSGTLQLVSPPGIAVPTSALIRADGGTAVWVVDAKTSTVAQRPVVVGANETNQVRIEKGLAPGDVVVTAGVQALRPGQKVSLLGTGK